jgi:RHS repeat-associated protein
MRKEYAWQGGQWLNANQTCYIYDGMRVLQERNVLNNPTVTYTLGLDLSGTMGGAGGIGGLLARTDKNGSAYYHTDGNGNVTMLVDGSGKMVAKYLYDSFGNTLGMWGTLATANTYRYSSKEQDPRTGQYYYGFRYYDSNLQRWLNQDPIGERGGVNLYQFVGNNPVNQIDPLGLQVPPQVMEALESPEAQELEEAIAADAEAAGGAAEADMASLMQKARELYPKLCNKFQWHHITPKYLGGDPNGPLVLLEGPYHQLITNAFRNLAPYGVGVPNSLSVQNIVNQVYSQYPLPK